MKVAKAKGRLRGKQPKPTERQQAQLVALHRSGEHTTAELAELFNVARSTVYRRSAPGTARRRPAPHRTRHPARRTPFPPVSAGSVGHESASQSGAGGKRSARNRGEKHSNRRSGPTCRCVDVAWRRARVAPRHRDTSPTRSASRGGSCRLLPGAGTADASHPPWSVSSRAELDACWAGSLRAKSGLIVRGACVGGARLSSLAVSPPPPAGPPAGGPSASSARARGRPTASRRGAPATARVPTG